MYIQLLQQLIATPSFSREEQGTAGILFQFLLGRGITPIRYKHNVIARNLHYSPSKKTILLCSHHDTVRPAKGYTRNPFAPTIEGDILYGLGSNDAGASVVALTAAFEHFYRRNDMPYNLVLALVAEEEVQGPDGLAGSRFLMEPLHCAIVGEPTQMQAAVGERGLVVLDCTAHGTQGHAARNEGDNALYRAVDDIQWIRHYQFPKTSELMGAVKMTATMISCGTQHNVVPAECKFVVDIRPNDQYTNEEIVAHIQQHLRSHVQPRSTRLRTSSIPLAHPLVQAAQRIGRSTYVSPTTSDIAQLRIPSLKMGPGDSARSHTADEYIRLSEVQQGIELYKQLLEEVFNEEPRIESQE